MKVMGGVGIQAFRKAVFYRRVTFSINIFKSHTNALFSVDVQKPSANYLRDFFKAAFKYSRTPL